jgi:hypothetical protein
MVPTKCNARLCTLQQQKGEGGALQNSEGASDMLGKNGRRRSTLKYEQNRVGS